MISIVLVYLLGTVPIFDSWVELQQGNEASLPVVLYVSRTDCTFCLRFEREALSPVIKSGAYTDAVLFREVILDDNEYDFGPIAESTDAFESEYNVVGTPTVLFLSPEGSEIGKRLVGYASSDFGSFLLERSIRQAIDAGQHSVSVSDRRP